LIQNNKLLFEKYSSGLLEKFDKEVISEISENNQNEIQIKVKDYLKIPSVCVYIYSSQQFRLSSIVCEEHYNSADQYTLHHIFATGQKGEDVFLVVNTSLPYSTKFFPSIALEVPSAVLYEREIRDMFGIIPDTNPDTRIFVAHEFWPEDIYPLRKDQELKPSAIRYRNIDVTNNNKDNNNRKDNKYHFHQVEGEGICEVPLGPVYSSITEPIHFNLSILGEEIINIETRLFYNHRGIEKLAEGMKFDNVLLLSERIAGDESVANSTAFCQAIEKLVKLEISENAAQTRVVCAELERTYNHLGTIAGLSADAGYTYGSARLNILKENIMQLNEQIAGNRILFGINRIGGTNIDIAQDRTKKAIKDNIIQTVNDFQRIVDVLRRKSSFIDRLRNTGIISRKVVTDLGAVGVAARAAGVDIDTRRDHPYAGYSKSFVERLPDIPEYQTEYEIEKQHEISDALSRFEIRIQEIKQSAEIIKKALDNINSENTVQPPPPFSIDDIQNRVKPFSSALGYAESHRGQTIHWISIGEDNKKISRYKVRTASFCNWVLIEHAIHGDIMLDFPIILRSLDLSSAANDL
jgi:Ni,Fe-hydrogenase III large subunit/Ni,Fe-hydrogenase III component G